MYYMFHEHHMLPSSYFNLSEGEKVIIRAMFLHTMENRKPI